MTRFAAAALAFAAVCCRAAEFQVSSEPKRLVNGAPWLIRVHTPAPFQSIDGEFLTSKFAFEYDRDAGVWWALAGLSFDLRPGKYTLKLEATAIDGRKEASEHPVTVFAGAYQISRIQVPQKYVSPPKAEMARIQAERDIKTKLFGQPPSPQRLWTFPFEKPVDATTTSPYGVQRVYNGVRRGVHTGLDFRALDATPVKAINNGKVLLARDMYYEGGFVVLDHGQGLISMYMHLSAFDVKDGDTVQRGQIIARSGGTGQSTGPHLHLGLRWQSALVDPLTIFGFQQPQPK